MGHPALTHIQEAGIDVLRASNTSGPQSHSVHVICEVTVKLTPVTLLQQQWVDGIVRGSIQDKHNTWHEEKEKEKEKEKSSQGTRPG